MTPLSSGRYGVVASGPRVTLPDQQGEPRSQSFDTILSNRKPRIDPAGLTPDDRRNPQTGPKAGDISALNGGVLRRM